MAGDSPLKTFLEKKEVHTDKQDGWGCRPGQTPARASFALQPVDRGENDTETRGRLSLPAALPPASLQNGGRGVKFADVAPGPRRSPTCREGPEYVRENRADGGVSERTLSSSRPFHAYLSYLRFPRDPQHTAVPLFYDS